MNLNLPRANSASLIEEEESVCFRHQQKEPPSQEAFNKLISWFGLRGENYQSVFDRLEMFFEANHCFHPEECVPETLDRAVRNRQADKVSVDVPPWPYCLVTARYVLSEYRRCKLNPLLLPEPSPIPDPDSASEETPEEREKELAEEEQSEQKRQACREGCLQKLKLEECDLVITYKKQKGKLKKVARALMALALGISPNALRQRVKRITKRLRKCYQDCLKTA